MMNTAHADSAALVAKITAHLSAGGRVMVKSYTRPTIYTKRHVDMFRATPESTGVRIGWPGRSSVFCYAGSIAFLK